MAKRPEPASRTPAHLAAEFEAEIAGRLENLAALAATTSKGPAKLKKIVAGLKKTLDLAEAGLRVWSYVGHGRPKRR